MFDLSQSAQFPDLWEISATACNLIDGAVYHYWFEVADSNPYKSPQRRIRCTDPTAWTVDWRLVASRLPDPYSADDQDPAGVIKYQNGELVPCDPGGETPDWNNDAAMDRLAPNMRLVIYELPTRWARSGPEGTEIAAGTFRDVLALIERDEEPTNFTGVAALEAGQAHLAELGVNALELLPPADSWVDREWGYATSNYFAADYNLGFPEGNASPTATRDLVELVKGCHNKGMRFFADVVMAFATRYPYQNINFLDFNVQANASDPEAFTVDANGTRKERNGFGGDLFKYNYWVQGYDPVSGTTGLLVPARQLMQTFLARWMVDFRIDGIRVDSVENIGNWDFVQQFTNSARQLWQTRWGEQGLPAADADARFLVAGEELAVPTALVHQGRLDALWNETFKRMIRAVILGQSDDPQSSFEWTVRKMIDCRLLGFSDGAQAVNYITSHDVGGFRNERLYIFLKNNGIGETEQRIKLAFVCLLTAVGTPMILAGEEFADEHDLPTTDFDKQGDPVNYSRREDPWRKRLCAYVARLVRLRTSNEALAVNDTAFLHFDFDEGKRVAVWRRGRPDSDRLVVVVANFSNWGTPNLGAPDAEYVVPNWPATPPGKQWREIT
ncbi:MAG TPA: alpha-amylase family glycosyl hydrolase [Ardenticatenaceae bacterium]|nr:alpha-amylase family glycosyl hydrolase [Ardenticatenaceae bacterium]